MLDAKYAIDHNPKYYTSYEYHSSVHGSTVDPRTMFHIFYPGSTVLDDSPFLPTSVYLLK